MKQPSNTRDDLVSDGRRRRARDARDATRSRSGGSAIPTGTVDVLPLSAGRGHRRWLLTARSATQVGEPVDARRLWPGDVGRPTNTTAIGKYCWRAEYSGDNFYAAGSHTNSTIGVLHHRQAALRGRRRASTRTRQRRAGHLGQRRRDRDGIQGRPTPTDGRLLPLPAERRSLRGCRSAGRRSARRWRSHGGAATRSHDEHDRGRQVLRRAVYSGDAFYNGSDHTNTPSSASRWRLRPPPPPPPPSAAPTDGRGDPEGRHGSGHARLERPGDDRLQRPGPRTTGPIPAANVEGVRLRRRAASRSERRAQRVKGTCSIQSGGRSSTARSGTWQSASR